MMKIAGRRHAARPIWPSTSRAYFVVQHRDRYALLSDQERESTHFVERDLRELAIHRAVGAGLVKREAERELVSGESFDHEVRRGATSARLARPGWRGRLILIAPSSSPRARLARGRRRVRGHARSRDSIHARSSDKRHATRLVERRRGAGKRPSLRSFQICGRDRPTVCWTNGQPTRRSTSGVVGRRVGVHEAESRAP